MFGLGFQEILVILLVALLLFGAQRLPEIARSLAKGLNEFKKGMREFSDTLEDGSDKEKDA